MKKSKFRTSQAFQLHFNSLRFWVKPSQRFEFTLDIKVIVGWSGILVLRFDKAKNKAQAVGRFTRFFHDLDLTFKLAIKLQITVQLAAGFRVCYLNCRETQSK